MASASAGDSPRVRPQVELVARTLRHEVGDLLQTVYASVAILQERLSPDLKLERRILADLRGRAETCKNLLDTVHDIVCPVAVAYETIDAGDLAAHAVRAAAARHPRLDVRAEIQATQPIQADPRHLTQIAQRLLHHACQRAQQRVAFRAGPAGEGEIEWSVTDDGPPVPDDQLALLAQPFQSTRPGTFGLDLGLARKLVTLHGGRLSVANEPEGGLEVKIVLPVRPLDQPGE